MSFVNYSKTDFKGEISILELYYEMVNTAYFLIESLQSGDKLALEIWQKSI